MIRGYRTFDKNNLNFKFAHSVQNIYIINFFQFNNNFTRHNCICDIAAECRRETSHVCLTLFIHRVLSVLSCFCNWIELYNNQLQSTVVTNVSTVKQ